MKTFCDIAYGAHEQNLLDIYVPENDNFDTIIWFHGGGLEEGSRKDIAFASDVVALGYSLVSVEYRMYPGAAFPDYIEDAAAAAAFVRKHIAQYGGNGKIYISGQSAGAYLTMMLCLNPAFLAEKGLASDDIAGFIADSAQQTVHFNVLRERGIDSGLERIDEAAPLFYVSRATAFSKLLMIYYSNDIPSRKEQNLLLYASIRHLCPGLTVKLVELEGCHCTGSSVRNRNGSFDFVTQLISFLED